MINREVLQHLEREKTVNRLLLTRIFIEATPYM